MRASRKSQGLVVVVAFAAIQIACASNGATDPRSDNPVVTLISPAHIAGVVGTVASANPTIRVTGKRSGRPVANAQVEFSIEAGTGSVAFDHAVTDASGTATAGEWQLGTRPGEVRLAVLLNGTRQTSIEATVVPAAPDHLAIPAGQDDVTIAGHALSSITVAVEDRYYNKVAGANVKFTVVEGGGLLQNDSVITDLFGAAIEPSWVIGSSPGPNQLTASLPGLQPVTFTAMGLDSSAVLWYDIAAVESGAQVLPPSAEYIGAAELALTSFDPCLCRMQRGYYMENIAYVYPGADFHSGGGYSLEGASLGILKAAPSARITGDSVLIDRTDLDMGFPVTWVYLRRRPPGS